MPEPEDIQDIPPDSEQAPASIVNANNDVSRDLLPTSNEKAVLEAISSGSAMPGDGRLRLNGSLDFEAVGVHIHCRTSPTGTPDGDGYRISLENDYDGADLDFLVIEKTDGNFSAVDGGIAFVMTGNDGVRREILRITDAGVEITGNLIVSGTINGTSIP